MYKPTEKQPDRFGAASELSEGAERRLEVELRCSPGLHPTALGHTPCVGESDVAGLPIRTRSVAPSDSPIRYAPFETNHPPKSPKCSARRNNTAMPTTAITAPATARLETWSSSK